MRNRQRARRDTAVAVSTAGCVESMDQGYGNSNGYYGNGYSGGYSSGYYPSSSYASSPGYYATPRVNNYYYNPSPTVVTQTRYVPVPTPVPVRTRDNRPLERPSLEQQPGQRPSLGGHRDNNRRSMSTVRGRLRRHRRPTTTITRSRRNAEHGRQQPRRNGGTATATASPTAAADFHLDAHDWARAPSKKRAPGDDPGPARGRRASEPFDPGAGAILVFLCGPPANAAGTDQDTWRKIGTAPWP